ncbi:hypothetical protein MMC21_003355 [Puttea exsequens]|nr:hypothetical protein [Puttea exsequens]
MSTQPIEHDESEVQPGDRGGDSVASLPRVSSDPEPESTSLESKYPPFFHVSIIQTDPTRNSTRSLSGSFLEEHFENGRRYCNQYYYMPDDDIEATRLSIVHQAYLPVLDGKLTLANIPVNTSRILDIGTGTGDWAIAIAERYPDAHVIATDITAGFQPSAGPPNCEFELDDASEEWAYSEAFDFVHVRGLTGAFADWSEFYAEVNKHLRPGGLLEVKDWGVIQLRNAPKDSWVSMFNGAVQSAAQLAGRQISLQHLRKEKFEKVGLSVVKTKSFEVPLGPYLPDARKKVAGKMAMIAALEGLEAVSLRLLMRHLAWKAEDVRELCAKVQEEVMDPDVRAFVQCQVVVARKLM